MRQPAKTLVGRVAYVEQPPIGALEAGGEDLEICGLRQSRRGYFIDAKRCHGENDEPCPEHRRNLHQA